MKLAGTPKPVKIKRRREGLEVGSGSMLLSSSGLGAPEEEGCVAVAEKARVPQAAVMDRGSGVGGGRVCGGGGGGGRGSDDGLGSGSQDPNSHGNENTDSYYRKMIEANPNNTLLLANYAKFLKEVLITIKSRSIFSLS